MTKKEAKQREGSSVLSKVQKILSQYLEKHGLRKTSERYAILSLIYEQESHFDVDNLYRQMHEKKQKVSRATLYNCLELFLDCDLVVQHRFSQEGAVYEKSYGYKQHDHLICTDCKRIVEFCDPRLHQIEQNVGDFLGFEVIHHSLLLYGKCRDEHCTHNPTQ